MTIVDAEGRAVAKAAVHDQWPRDGTPVAQQQATTGRTGVAKFTYPTPRNSVYELCVTDVVKAGWEYWEEHNVVTCGSVEVP